MHTFLYITFIYLRSHSKLSGVTGKKFIHIFICLYTYIDLFAN